MERDTEQAVVRTVGAILRRLRISRGLTQAALAQRCGLSHQQIHKYENGQATISVVRMLRLAEVLGVAPSAFMHEIEAAHLHAEAPYPPAPRQAHRMVHYFERIESPVVQRKVTGLMREVARFAESREPADLAEAAE